MRSILGLLLLLSPSVFAQSLSFERCLPNVGAQQIDAECATLVRPENPATPNARNIDLAVIKLPAYTTEPADDAFTLIQGGPGGSSIDLGIAYSQYLESVRKTRDVLIIDQRGTGRSNILRCPEIDPALISFEAAVVKQQALDCVNSIDADLRFYTTSIAVDDLEALREAAGYAQLTIYGVSYGTRVAQHYLRKYPQHSRAVILDGVVHIGLNLAGGEIARRSQAAFDGLANRCARSADCNSRFGNLKVKLSELHERLRDEPVELVLPDPIHGQLIEKTLNRHDLLGVLRLMAYSTESNALLPMILSEAHAGNYLPLAAQSLMLGSDFLEGYAVGMNNSVMCAEDEPFVKAADTTNLQDTYFGSEMVDAMRATCAVWPRGPVDKEFHQPFDSDVPILILSGETDPITPPENGEIAQKMFSNSHHIVVPAHGHGVLLRGCVAQLSINFIEDASLENLSTSCVARERATPFFNSVTGPKP